MNLEFERFFIFYYSRPDIQLNLNHARAVYPFLPYLSPIPPYLLKINYCFINNFGYISSMYPTFQPYPLVVYIRSVSYNWYGSKVEVYMLPSCMLSRSKIQVQFLTMKYGFLVKQNMEEPHLSFPTYCGVLANGHGMGIICGFLRQISLYSKFFIHHDQLNVRI